MKQKLAILAVVVAVAAFGCWTAMAFYNPEVREVDIDVDSDYNGAIEAADDGSEVSAGGIVCVGGWTNITIKQSISTAQPGDQNLARLSWLPGHIELSETSGGAAIAPDGTLSNGRHYKDYPGLNTTKTLWVHGVDTSHTARAESIQLESQQYKDYGASYDEIRMTVCNAKIEKVVDSDGRLAIGGLLEIVNLISEPVECLGKFGPDSLTLPSGYPQWNHDGGDVKTGVSATYDIANNALRAGLLFAVAESPRVHTITFDCQFSRDSTTVKAYSSEERSLSISGSELSGPKAAVDRALQFIFPDINIDGPSGKIEFANRWQECPNSNLAYWTYELSAGFDPVIGAHAKFPLGAGAVIPRWISRRVNAGFYLKLEGKLIWVGMLERNECGVTSGSAPLTGEVGGEVGYELVAGGARGFVGMTIAGGTSFTGGGDVVVDLTARKIVLKDAKVNWDGVVLNVTIDMWWGRIERSRSWVIIAPPATPVWGPTDLSFPP